MQEFAVIVAGGSGTRMGSSLPKQFLPVLGLPLVLHTLKRFAAFRPSMRCVLVLPAQEDERFLALFKQHPQALDLPLLAPGGASRCDSVLSGLHTIQKTYNPGSSLVAVHDAVRPLFSKRTLNDAMDAAARYGCGIPVIPVNETVRKLDASGSELVDRDALRLIQTPQCFVLEELLHSYALCGNKAYTDDASVWEASGRSLYFTEGNLENIKITRPADLPLAEFYLSKQPTDS